jgi:protein O-GlcNAc transferase
VHILVDLNGYTKGARTGIFALKPSPIQIQFMGFAGTMGADFIDYIIGDITVIPEAFRMYYKEKVLYMPHSYYINDYKESYSSTIERHDKSITREKYGLSEDSFVFCNFNQLFKISPEIFDVWMKILKRIPNSVLWLLKWPALAESNLKQEAKKRGVRDDQIHFTDVVPKSEHLARCYLADLCLDTPVYNSHASACDVLWAGTPMITLPGDRMASRVGASILTAAGMDELICHSFAEYEELAVTLATDVNKLYHVRQKLESSRQTCALFDTARYVKNLEIGIERIWEKYEARQITDHIFVEDKLPLGISTGENIFDAKDENPMLSGFNSPVIGSPKQTHEVSDSYGDDVFEKDITSPSKSDNGYES